MTLRSLAVLFLYTRLGTIAVFSHLLFVTYLAFKTDSYSVLHLLPYFTKTEQSFCSEEILIVIIAKRTTDHYRRTVTQTKYFHSSDRRLLVGGTGELASGYYTRDMRRLFASYCYANIFTVAYLNSFMGKHSSESKDLGDDRVGEKNTITLFTLVVT